MKISGIVIQNRSISKNTENDFIATYKERIIEISTNHDLGSPKWDHLKRYNIEVTFNGSYEVNTWQDFHTMRDAIRYALIGACLIPNPMTN